MRSASLGVDDRAPLSLSALAGLQESDVHDESAVAVPSVEDQEPAFGPMFDAGVKSNDPIDRERSLSYERREEAGSIPTRGVYRPRIGREADGERRRRKGRLPALSSGVAAVEGLASLDLRAILRMKNHSFLL